MARSPHVPPTTLTSSDVAHRLSERGYHVIPLVHGQKAAVDRGWTKLRLTPQEVSERWDEDDDYGVGVLLGTEVAPSTFLVAIDIDVNDETLIDRVISAIPGPPPPPGKRGSKGITFFATSNASWKKTLIKRQKEANAVIEILGLGQQTVVPPSFHPKGMSYEWANQPLHEIDPPELPVVTQETILEIRIAAQNPDANIFMLNDLKPSQEGEPGNYHDHCSRAVASMVAFEFSDSYIETRVLRAMRLADIKYGHEGRDYERAETSKIKEWIESARKKDFGKKRKAKDSDEKPDVTWAKWLCHEWMGENAIYARGGQLLVWDRGYYKPHSPEEFYRVLARCGSEEIAGIGIRGWRTITDTTTAVAPEFPERVSRKVCFANGTYDFATGELSDWSRDDCLISGLSFAYDADAACPVYERFLSETFANEEMPEATQQSIDCFEEFVAMTMFECHVFHKFLVLHGDPRTGKGRLTKVLEYMHADDAKSSVPAHNLGSEHARTSMLGKLINVSGETSTVSSVADDYLKLIVAGDRVDVRHLYHGGFCTVLPTRLVIATNDPLKTKDSSGAVLERMLVVKCNNIVPPDKRDPLLDDKFFVERPGIFNRMTRAWVRLWERGRFITPSNSREDEEQFNEDNNAALAFILDQTHQGTKVKDPTYEYPANMVHMTEGRILYLAYVEWAKLTGRMVMAENTFGVKLLQIKHPMLDLRSVPKRLPSGVIVRMRQLSLLNPMRY